MRMLKFKNESEMSKAIRNWLMTAVFPKLSENFALLHSHKSLDIPICMDGKSPKLFFLELKCHQSKHGRLGIGHGKGGGFQVEILKKRVDYFERYLRWLIAYPEKYPNKYLLLTTAEVREYISGGSVGEKYHNLNLAAFRKCKLCTEEDLKLKLVSWLEEREDDEKKH